MLLTLQAVQCRNHIRAVYRVDDTLYVCSTGAYSPQEFYLNVSIMLNLMCVDRLLYITVKIFIPISS